MNQFKIYDWAGNRITNLEFSTFSEAWEYIHTTLTEELDLIEEDYSEYHVAAHD